MFGFSLDDVRTMDDIQAELEQIRKRNSESTEFTFYFRNDLELTFCLLDEDIESFWKTYSEAEDLKRSFLWTGYGGNEFRINPSDIIAVC